METTCIQKIQQQFPLEGLAVCQSPNGKQWQAELMALRAEGQKRCTKCLKVFQLSDFHKKSGTKDGRSPRCKYCRYKENKEYYSSEHGKIIVSGQTKRKWIRIKQKVNCRNIVNIAMSKGKLCKKPCAVCGSTDLIEAHHDDYSKPFDIIWLCRDHHNEKHGKRTSKI